jgi:hypothetical protein
MFQAVVFIAGPFRISANIAAQTAPLAFSTIETPQQYIDHVVPSQVPEPRSVVLFPLDVMAVYFALRRRTAA